MSQSKSKPIKPADEEAYYKEARSWDEDREAAREKSERRAWFVAKSSWVLNVLLGIALATLVPLKETEPWLVGFDRSTGMVEQMVRVKDASLGSDELMNRYFLLRYVVLRESYRRATIQDSYDELMLMSSEKVGGELTKAWQFDNPDSPYKRLGENGRIDVQHVGTTFLPSQKDVAQVRIAKIDRQGSGGITHWVATIRFTYSKTPASQKAREKNPLGFTVIDYKVDPESEVVAPLPKQLPQ